MSTEANMAICSRLVESYFNKDAAISWDELVHESIIVHGVNLLKGSAECLAFFAGLRKVFPDWHFEIKDTIAQGDRVVFRMTESGTLKGLFMGMSPTGKSYEVSAIQIFRLADGMVAEIWGVRDTGSMLRQIGASSL